VVILSDKNGEEIRKVYPISNNPDNLFRTIFNKNSANVLNQLNFISKNYRPKCDMCSNLCDMEWYMQKVNEAMMIDNHISKSANSNGSFNGNGTINGQVAAGSALGNGISSTKIFLACNTCYESDNFSKDLTKEDFEFANFFNIINPSSNESNIINKKLRLS